MNTNVTIRVSPEQIQEVLTELQRDGFLVLDQRYVDGRIEILARQIIDWDGVRGKHERRL